MMELIKELRDKTGAGMVDCKKALEEGGNDIEKAIEVLRKRGMAKAAKRGDRETSEGIVKVATNDEHTTGYMIEIDAETDFVVRSERFQEFANNVITLAQQNKITTLEALLVLPMADGHSVTENLETLSGVLGEKLVIRKMDVLNAGTVVAYSHMGGRIGVLVSLDAAGVAELGHDIAMQIAAANPRYISPEQVPQVEIDKEKAIYTEQLAKEGKPAEMIEKIMAGKINKFFEEVCLVKQEFIKDDTKKVQDILGAAKVEKFIVYSLTGGSNCCVC